MHPALHVGELHHDDRRPVRGTVVAAAPPTTSRRRRMSAAGAINACAEAAALVWARNSPSLGKKERAEGAPAGRR